MFLVAASGGNRAIAGHAGVDARPGLRRPATLQINHIMIFNSVTFLVFFVVVLAAHQLPVPWTVKKVNLLLASYLFYAAWNPPFVLLLIVSACVDYWLARWIGRLQSRSARGALLTASLGLNLGL